jgi:hypothetical protein
VLDNGHRRAHEIGRGRHGKQAAALVAVAVVAADDPVEFKRYGNADQALQRIAVDAVHSLRRVSDWLDVVERLSTGEADVAGEQYKHCSAVPPYAAAPLGTVLSVETIVKVC